jgi:hypothetical protein
MVLRRTAVAHPAGAPPRPFGFTCNRRRGSQPKLPTAGARSLVRDRQRVAGPHRSRPFSFSVSSRSPTTSGVASAAVAQRGWGPLLGCGVQCPRSGAARSMVPPPWLRRTAGRSSSRRRGTPTPGARRGRRASPTLHRRVREFHVEQTSWIAAGVADCRGSISSSGIDIGRRPAPVSSTRPFSFSVSSRSRTTSGVASAAVAQRGWGPLLGCRVQ